MTDPRVVELIDSLIHNRCGRPVDLCPCAPRPLPEPPVRAAVLNLRRVLAAEIAAEPTETIPGSVTPDAPHTPAVAPSGPVCSLSPKWGAA